MSAADFVKSIHPFMAGAGTAQPAWVLPSAEGGKGVERGDAGISTSVILSGLTALPEPWLLIQKRRSIP